MNAMTDTTHATDRPLGVGRLDPEALQRAGTELLYREGMLLDEHRWDEWLALYTPGCEYWMPMWRSETLLGEDPKTCISHIYYDSRKGLEDRVARIRSARHAPSATPLPRTAHQITNVLPLQAPTASHMRLRASWACHVLYTRNRQQHVFFGWAEYDLARREGGETDAGWLFTRKKIMLLNDDIPTMLDVYCV